MPPIELGLPPVNEFTAAPEVDDLFKVDEEAFQASDYQQGYGQALQNLLAWLVPLAEQHLDRDPIGSPTARRQVYGFIEYLERHLERTARDAGYVADGLGI